MDDVLEIATAPLEVKGASVVLHQRVDRDGETLVEATVQVAFVSGGRARPIPKALRDAMKAGQDSAGRGFERPPRRIVRPEPRFRRPVRLRARR